MDTRNAAPALPPGTKLFGYEIVDTLGSGAFGIVYRATLLEIGGTVAIKEFLPAQLARRRADGCVEPIPDQVEAFQWSLEQFRKEARTLHALANPEPHPNIIKVELVFETNETVYFSMRWEEGRPLDEVITPSQPWPETRLRALLRALLEGLERVHTEQVLHRDIKPSNLLLRPDGSPVLIDFGAARRVSANAVQSRYIVQTPGFAPPEQAWGEYGPWTDLYGLAASIYNVLTGDQPNAFKEQRRLLSDDLAGVYSEPFLRALDAALEPDHRKRPQSVGAWRELFGPEMEVPLTEPTQQYGNDTLVSPGGRRRPNAAGGDTSQQQQPGGVQDPTAQRSRRGRGNRPIAMAIALLLAAAAFGFWLWQTGKTVVTPPPTPPATPAAQRSPQAPPEPASEQTPAGAPPEQAPEAGEDKQEDASAEGPSDSRELDRRAPVEPAPPPPLPDAGTSIRAALASLDCARIELTEIGERSFELSGYVGGPTTLETLRAGLLRIPSIRVDIGGIEVLSPAVCATLYATRPYAAADATADTPRIQLNHRDGRYRIGDPFAVDILNHTRHSGRLHLFFISAADEVMAFPNSFGKLLYRQDSVREAGFDVDGPAGADLILAVWCRGGVELPKTLAEPATTKAFLPLLRAAIERAGDCGTSSRVLRVTD